jgi:hypothetical protein
MLPGEHAAEIGGHSRPRRKRWVTLRAAIGQRETHETLDCALSSLRARHCDARVCCDRQFEVPRKAGRIALMQRGTCTFRVKALNAQSAGASAAVIFNRGGGENGPINGTLGSPGVAIPTIGVSFAVGGELFSTDSSVVAHVFTSTIAEIRTTSNVLAETPGGRADKVVVAGAHLARSRPARASPTTGAASPRCFDARAAGGDHDQHQRRHAVVVERRLLRAGRRRPTPAARCNRGGRPSSSTC